MPTLRKIVEIDDELCDGCGQCVPACAEGAIRIVDGKARLIAERYCDGLGACLGDCPKGALTVVEREAEAFDEEAVEAYLEQRAQREAPREPAAALRCPSTLVQDFTTVSAPEPGGPSLSHWPVQVRLVPPTAPFLKGADLVIVADCAPVAYPGFQAEFVTGKVVMLGCPKFDDPEEYIRKFAAIFRNAGIRSITTLMMEVPCCSGLSRIVRKALEEAGRDIPFEEIVISTRGRILKRKPANSPD